MTTHKQTINRSSVERGATLYAKGLSQGSLLVWWHHISCYSMHMLL